MNELKRSFEIYSIKLLWSILFGLIIPALATAQKDSTKRQSIDIISNYKPALKNISKVNLTPSPLSIDTTTPKLKYSIPSLNLFFSYQPISLKPLAFITDTSLQKGIRNYVKFGYGNFSTPFLQAAFSGGDGQKSIINLYAGYFSSKGKVLYQDVSKFNLKIAGSYFLTNSEVYGSVNYNLDKYNQYGYDHAVHTFPKDSIGRNFNDAGIHFGLKSTNNSENKISYNPELAIHLFSEHLLGNETNVAFSLPMKKIINEEISAELVVKEDITSYHPKSTLQSGDLKNNLFQINPVINYHTSRYNLHAGILPSFYNQKVAVLPDITASVQVQPNLFVRGGLQGDFIRNSFRSFSVINPYINSPTFLFNTKQVQLFGSVTTKIRHHMDVIGRVAFIRYSNMPLYVNDRNSGKGFDIINEEKMSDLNFFGEVRYYSQDKFSITGSLDVNTYSGLKNNANAWGLIPFKFNVDAKWNITQDVLIKGKIYSFSGIPVLLQNNVEKTLPAASDISVGTEVKVSKHLHAWLDIDNLLNKKYQRWNNYPVYGLQILGGFIYRF